MPVGAFSFLRQFLMFLLGCETYLPAKASTHVYCLLTISASPVRHVISFAFTLLLFLALTIPAQGQAFSDPELSAPAWQTFEEAEAAAAEGDQFFLVDVYADWCGWCRRLEREVYADDEVQAYLEQHFAYTRLDFDATDRDVAFKGDTFTMQQMAYLLGAQGVPTVAFLAPDGNYITHVPGFVERDDFLDVLRFIATEAYKEQSWEEFVAAEE